MTVNDLSRSPAIKPALGLFDAIAITVGIVIGSGIFKLPAFVAGNAGSSTTLMLLWVAGGIISLIGALCYAELATTYPHPGGNYYYLKRSFGRPLAFLFAWARMTVIQPGSIAALGFVFGDYATRILPLGANSTTLYAVASIIAFTGLNLLGVQQTKWSQNLLASLEILGLVLIAVVGLFFSPAAPAAPPATVTDGGSNSLGLAMVFVLFAYGGWNEAAYISAELRQVQRNMLRSLVWSIGIISAAYLLVNLAFLRGLGLTGLASSKAVAADLIHPALGNPGVWLIGLIICLSALSSLNASILTGARTNYALGQDFKLFGFLGNWGAQSSTPVPALLLQAAISLALTLLGSWQQKGFQTMVDYTSPVFWLFFLLTGIALFLLRKRDRRINRPFQVPLYPVLPIVFCLVCGYMLYSSLAYAFSLSYNQVGALVGLGVLLAGIPFLWFTERL